MLSIALGIAGVALMLFFVVVYAHNYYAQHLALVDETVHVGGRILSVENGAAVDAETLRESFDALRLAYAVTMVRRNPLWSLEGTNIAQLVEANEELARAQADLMTHVPREHAIFVEKLYSTEQVAAQAQLEYARRAFLDERSFEGLRQYERAQRTAVHTYLKSLYAFSTTFDDAVPPDTKSYVTAHNVVHRSGMIEALSSLRTRTKEPVSEMIRRTYCVRGIVFLCPGTIALPNLPEIAHTPVDSAAIQLSEDVREVYANSRAFAIPRLTIYALHESSCIDTRHTPSLFATRPYYANFPSLSETMRVLLVGNIRFIKTEAERDVAYFEFFRTHDIPYIPIHEFNFYSCPLMDADTATVLALRAIHERIENAPFSTLFSPPAQDELYTYEQRVLGDVLMESEIRAYIQRVVEIARASRNTGALNEVLPYAIMLRDGSAGYESIVADVALMTHALTHRLAQNIPSDITPASLYMFRSGLVPLYFGSNRSFGVPVHPFEPKPNDLKEPFVYLSDLKKQGVTLETLTDSVKAYYSYAPQPE